MTIQIELNPEIMERLAAEAAARGIAVEDYVERLLREAIATRAEPQGQISVARTSHHAQRDCGRLGEVVKGAHLGIHP